ncbi:hypothetical protein [Priestia filamentosa]|uniref:Uncharacterized protein n=1 Tax=Priestia filamentosa TaxID=1402861 RepID=A0A1X7E2M1_9BACI|nr:hypothetical protein [Priestia filamentosa]AKO92297.1 hypothetical protein BEH_09445 [Priestia filamentosa]MDT3762334.1 hypothetical protein [Priestia filamentosa]OXS68897.1 hypothetical protein B1B01_07860 [Priestia filamentosa]RJS64399.1 hypothetical protein CJ485_06455 [Priestia filamentosa]WCM17409.1 hypothetical protein PGN40_08670 [Priestia filamentosa]
MLELQDIKKLRETVQENFALLSTTYHEDYAGVPMIKTEVEEGKIRGGFDVLTKNRELYATRTGWDLFEYEGKTHSYEYSGEQITKSSHAPLTDEELLNLYVQRIFNEKELKQFEESYHKYCEK